MDALHSMLAWGSAAVALTIMIMTLLWGARCQRSSALSSSTKRESLVALRSGVVLLIMTIPFLAPPLVDRFPANFEAIYPSLPFWYCFIVDTHWGRCLHNSYHALLGVLLATLVMAFLNYLMPGGAGPWARDPQYVEEAWVPGGYNRGLAICTGILVAYLFFLIDFGVPTKQYGLATFASILLAFMDPKQGHDDFRGVLWTYEGVPTLGSPTWCQLYLNVMAITLALLTLPSGPSVPFCPRQTSWCWDDAKQGYARLAEDTVLGFDRVVRHFREGSSAFALDTSAPSSSSRISALGAGRWRGSWRTPAGRRGPGSSRSSAGSRGCCAACGRCSASRWRTCGSSGTHSISTRTSRKSPSTHLDNFLVACRDAVTFLGERELMRKGADAEALVQVASCAREGREALTLALDCLCPGGTGNERTTRLETVFIEGLQTWAPLVDEFLEEPEVPPKQGCLLSRLWREMKCPSREKHVNALRLCTPWSLALLWSVFKRDYDPTVVSSVSFIFSESLSCMFDRNINRMLGVAMGQVLGTLPAVLLSYHAACQDNQGAELGNAPRIVRYMVVMFLLWSTAMYGYLATGAKWSYAYLLWAAFGGVKMISYFPAPGNDLFEECVVGVAHFKNTAETFLSILDNFTGCLLLVFVDVIFAANTSNLTIHRLARRIPNCLQNILVIMEGLMERDTASANIDGLQQHVAIARQIDEETEKEDLVWSHLFTQPYNRELVSATLSECDNFFVAVYALRAADARCGSQTSVPDAMLEVVPRGLMARVQRYPAIFQAILLDRSGSCVEQVEEASFQPHASGSSSVGQNHAECLRFRHVASIKRHAEENVSAASLMVVRVRIWQICLSLQRLRVIFEERADWAAEERDRAHSSSSRARLLSRSSRRKESSESCEDSRLRKDSSGMSEAGRPVTADTLPMYESTPVGAQSPAVRKTSSLTKAALRNMGRDVSEFAAASRRGRLATRARGLSEDCGFRGHVDPEEIDLNLEAIGEASPPSGLRRHGGEDEPRPLAGARPGEAPAPRWAASLLPCCPEARARLRPHAPARGAERAA
ncbi:unnamed protein product [Prorocentrum cordatum]|uniref:Uncharacterized protein n=1 Tax=Prorocentrum cordatum TaxID=2364126 RepID=A0ABN9X4V2_9DINO|nr:unnamed protein product [Polarella glacialis]